MSDLEQKFHERWLGMVQPSDGLVVSVPVLVDAQCMQRLPPAEQERFRAHTAQATPKSPPRVRSLLELCTGFLGFRPDDFVVGEALPEALSLYVVEGRQLLRPSFALKRVSRVEEAAAGGIPDDSTPASRAGRDFEVLYWEVPEGLSLDRAEAVTGAWSYPPAAKFERLLRACRVPVGLLSNGDELRLMYAPHGESTGSIGFQVGHMLEPGGRPILDAFKMLLSAERMFSALPEHQLPALLRDSRLRQLDVTEALATQVFEAIELLLAGFESAAERDRTGVFEEALRRGDDHVYGGLLTTLLRMVFVLYAEDRGLLPVERPEYESGFGLLALFEELQGDAAAYPDSMSRRFGAWPRLLALFRAVFFGARHGGLDLPARKGQLFDPQEYPFLEGWTGGGAPVRDGLARARVRVPSVDDETVYRVLERLVFLDGQRLSYRALDVEQLGSVYEALMGYHVRRLESPGVCVKPSRVWVSTAELLEKSPGERADWLVEEAQAEKKAVKAAAAALKAAKSDAEMLEALEPLRVKQREPRQAGRVVLQPGEERRRTSSHYTPRSLSAPIVRRTLEPLLQAMGGEPSSERLLNLKVCDPAMGSGAFLVEACRFLGDQVVAAWTREGQLDKVADTREDVVLRARRLVAQRCLYGVDRNPYAVNLAKLSLWLVTLAKDEPFTFLDHALKHGDSLVGASLEQVQGFHWAPEKQEELFAAQVREAVDDALVYRQKILELAYSTQKDHQLDKQHLLDEADHALARVRLIADVLLGAFFEEDSERARNAERLRRSVLVSEWLAKPEEPAPEELKELQRRFREKVPAFHWMLEYPEVFYGKRPDPLEAERVNQAAWMDAFVGNPPFAGKNGIAAMGEAYLPWLQAIHEGAHGNADYSAHFFRRAFELLGKHGTLGLIATNTIAQGDTRATGLQYLVGKKGRIYDATRSMKWPGTANVAVSVVHVAKGKVGEQELTLVLDGKRVEAINSRLRPKPERADPKPLKANEGLSFQGAIVLGMGFTLTPEEREELVRKDPRNAERIFPYLGGEEVNSRPEQDFERYVINFGESSLEEAERWPDLIERVRKLVKPERDRLRDTADGKKLKAAWWLFARARRELNEALGRVHRCLVNSQVSKHLVFAWQPVQQIFGHTLYAYTAMEDSWLAVLQSRVHERWARLLSSSMRTDLRYSPSECFDTFPFPPAEAFAGLAGIGERLHTERAAYMKSTQQGLTATYNQLKDPGCDHPRILALRELHLELDRQVLAAYAWSDLVPPPYTTPRSPEEEATLEAFSDEVLDRLFALNEARAKEEALLGASASKPKPRGPKKGGPKAKGQTPLLEE